MTQEEKQLVLKTLCSMLPYGVKVQVYDNRYAPVILTQIDVKKQECIFNFNVPVENCLPYLRPISSMTEEEKADLEMYSKQELDKYEDDVLNLTDKDTIRCSRIAVIYKDIDWYNKNHFDYRSLIPKGLALEAPEGMYNI